MSAPSSLITSWLPIIISVISLSVSLFELISRLIRSRTKINVLVDFNAGIDYFHASKKITQELSCCVACLFVNNAESDIAITKIELLLSDGSKSVCTQREHSFFTYSNPVPNGAVAKSVKFPINMHRMQGTYGVLCFDIPYSQEPTKVADIIIHTNKKSVHDAHFVSEMNLAISKLFEQVNQQYCYQNNSGQDKTTQSNHQ